MRPSPTVYFQDEAWQQLASDIDDVVRTLVVQVDSPTQLPSLRQRLAEQKLDYLKLRLGGLKYSLQQELERLEERLRVTPHDEKACHFVAIGAERWTDMWLRERALQRLANSADPGIDPGSIFWVAQLPGSSEAA